MDLTIAVLHYNRWDLTKDCLASIDTQEIPCTYEKVLVDNGSDHALPEPLPGWRIVRSEPNRGNIGGQNLCFEHAKGTWVLFVANDVRLQPRCIRGIWNSTIQVFPFAAQIQPALFTPTGEIDQTGMSWRWPGYGISRKANQSGFVQIIPSSCYFMRRDTWKNVGGFDETLLSSHEDVDMGLRLVGEKVVRTNSHAIHLGNATLKYTLSNHRQVFHDARLRVIRKHYRGLNYWSRYLAIQLLDHLPRVVFPLPSE